jgi:uncharacterized protein YecE (DUF72 family)
MESFMNAPVGLVLEKAGDADLLLAPHPGPSVLPRIASSKGFNDHVAMKESGPEESRAVTANAPKAASASSSRKSVIRVGPAGWSYPDWFGYVYPTPKRRGFHEAAYLAQFFDTIEINTSFYSPIRPEHAFQWINRVASNPRFVFTAKLLKKFTHDLVPDAPTLAAKAAIAEDEKLVRAGFNVLHQAGKLHAVLLQFPFSFHRDAQTTRYLEYLLKHFSDYPLVVEVRHASWQTPETFALLAQHNAGFCNIDQPIIGKSVVPSAQATSPVGYVRLHGRRYDTWFSDDEAIPAHERYNYLYSVEELKPWARRVEKIAEQSREVFVITNNHFNGKAAVSALQLIHLLTSAKVKVPEPLRGAYPQLNAIADAPPEAPSLFPDAQGPAEQ